MFKKGKNNKNLIIIAACILATALLTWIFAWWYFIGLEGNETEKQGHWECSNGNWVMVGETGEPKPEKECGNNIPSVRPPTGPPPASPHEPKPYGM